MPPLLRCRDYWQAQEPRSLQFSNNWKLVECAPRDPNPDELVVYYEHPKDLVVRFIPRLYDRTRNKFGGDLAEDLAENFACISAHQVDKFLNIDSSDGLAT